MVLRLLFLAFVALGSLIALADDLAREIIAEAIEASGGMAAWQGVRDAVIKERQVRYTDRGEVETEAIHFIKVDVVNFQFESDIKL